MNKQKQKSLQKISLAIAITAVLLVMMHIPRVWIYNNDGTFCIHKNLFGIECPFCGMTRAFYEIIHFNFIRSLHNNFVIIPFLMTLVLWLTTLVFHNPSLRKTAWVMTILTFAGFTLIYILRIAGLN